MKQIWWKESVVYQIYPRSFCDSTGNGIGDLRGIIQKLDYLKELGADVVWLSPVYQSPNDDNGYDISDYQAINPEFGTMADWDELLAGMHQRGIKLVMDLVVNHTSDEHPWFVESRASKDNPKRDWYFWRPGKDGAEPNNWMSMFGGSAWELDPATGEYYLHLFSKKQPDLNWDNPEVRQAVFGMMRWWLDKGIDGFRMDVINMVSKVPGLPDAPVTAPGPYQFDPDLHFHGPRLMEYLAEMKRDVLSKYDVISVGETPGATPEMALAITHEDDGPLGMLFQFEHMGLDTDESRHIGKWAIKPLDLRDLKQTTTRWQKGLENGGWNSLYLSNHDQPRSVSRFGDDGQYRVESAKMLATFLHMQQGTPYIYQGEEIGMTNMRFECIDDCRDIETFNMYRAAVGSLGIAPDEAMAMIYAKGRDNARTPMQWDDSANAGFTTGTPWIKVNPNYTKINVKEALADPNSVFHYYQKLIQLRKQHPVVAYGTYDSMLDDDPQVYAFTRTLGSERLLVILNFSKGTPAFVLPESTGFNTAELLIGNYPVDAAEHIRSFTLRPYEARVYRMC